MSLVRTDYKETEIGLLPVDWEVKALGECAALRTGPFGSALHKSDYTLDGVPVVNPMHIVDGNIMPSRAMTITEAAASALSDFRLCPGEVVIGRRGDMGRCAVVQEPQRGWLCGTGSMIIRPFSVDPAFLQRVVSSPRAVAAIVDASVGTTMVNINQETLRRLPIQSPSLSEQRRISEALSDVDALLAGLDRLIAKKRDLKQAAMQQLLTGRIRLPGFQGEWTTKRLGQICEIAMGRTPPRLDPAMWGEGHVWLSIADLTEKVVEDSKEQVTDLAATLMTVIPKGTLLMSFKLSIGRLCFAGCDLFTNEAICSFNKLQANAEFLFYQLGRTDFSLYGKQAVKGYTLNKVSLSLVEVTLPPPDEQAAIAASLSDLDVELAALESRRDKTCALKQAMMQELLTGRIRLI